MRPLIFAKDGERWLTKTPTPAESATPATPPAMAAAPPEAAPVEPAAAKVEVPPAEVAAAPVAAPAPGDVVDPAVAVANSEKAAMAGGEGEVPEDLLAQANENSVPDADAFKLPSFQQVMADAQVSSIDLLRDVELNVKIELGRSRMFVEDVLKLNEGSVVELDKLAGDPVDVFVNDRLVARGEVLVLNDNFCVRVNEIVAGVKEEGL
jgi:flagellar motor switch protein FliN/FliY